MDGGIGGVTRLENAETKAWFRISGSDWIKTSTHLSTSTLLIIYTTNGVIKFHHAWSYHWALTYKGPLCTYPLVEFLNMKQNSGQVLLLPISHLLMTGIRSDTTWDHAYSLWRIHLIPMYNREVQLIIYHALSTMDFFSARNYSRCRDSTTTAVDSADFLSVL